MPFDLEKLIMKIIESAKVKKKKQLFTFKYDKCIIYMHIKIF